MGEYAIRKSDRQRIKIGTCESMYYIRLEHKHKVQPEEGSRFGWFWRLPCPDEDGIEPGAYESHVKTVRLWKKVEGSQYRSSEDFTAPNSVNNPGTIQLKHECGLLLNVPCYHGEKLPETDQEKTGIKAFWNGKGWFFELRFLKTQGAKVYPIVHCRACGNMWRCDWEEILPYVHGELKKRLEVYQSQND